MRRNRPNLRAVEDIKTPNEIRYDSIREVERRCFRKYYNTAEGKAVANRASKRWRIMHRDHQRILDRRRNKTEKGRLRNKRQYERRVRTGYKKWDSYFYRRHITMRNYFGFAHP